MPAVDIDSGTIVSNAAAIVNVVSSDSKCVFRRSSGTILSISPSPDGKTIYVTEYDPATGTVTPRASKATSGTEVMRKIVGAIWATDNISIAYQTNDRVTIRHAVYDAGAHTISGWENVRTNSTVLCDAWDLDVSDSGMVVCVYNQYNPDTNAHQSVVRSRAIGATTWAQIHAYTNFTWSNYSPACDSMGVVCLGTNSGRNVVYAAGRGYRKGTAGAGKDQGVQMRGIRINETTGALVGTAPNIYGNYFAGDADCNSTTANNRFTNLYRISGNSYVIGVAHREGSKRFGTMGFSYNAGTWSQIYAFKTGNSSVSTTPRAIASSYDGKNFTFFFSTAYSGASPRIHNYICKNADTGVNYTINGVYQFDTVGSADAGIASMGGRNALQGSNWILWFYGQSGSDYKAINRLAYSAIPTNLPITGGQALREIVNPATGSFQTATPTVSAKVTVDTYASQSKYKMEWQFATDSLFTTSLKDWVWSDSQGVVITGGSTPVTLSQTLPQTYALSGAAPWYVRTRLVDEWGNVGPWVGSNTFTIAHPPTATPTFPLNSSFVTYGSGTITFRWDFTDPSDGDYQTAYEVNVLLPDDSGGTTSVEATGKVSSGDNFVSFDLTGYKEIPLMWQVRVWDSDDTVGLWSQVINFTLTDPPTADITYPVSGDSIATGVPTIQFTPTAGGDRTIKDYTLTVTQNGVVIWSKRVYGPWDSGTPLQLKIPQGYLLNNSSYSVQVSVTDSGNMQGSSSLTQFSVAWTPPAGPTDFSIDDSFYDQEDEGYVKLNWSGDARDPDFYGWAVYRQDSLIDPYSYEVLDVGDYKLIGVVYDSLDAYEFNDYFAPSSYQCSYLVHQIVNRDGQEIESANTDDAITVQPISEGYWLINPTTDNMSADAFKLSLVVGDSFTDEQEEAEFTVIGRGRVVNKGQLLGYNGTLDVRLRNTDGTSARQKRLRLKSIKEAETSLWLRNPFGDIFRVNVSDLSISRIAGVGLSEFCDVSIPYKEVAK